MFGSCIAVGAGGFLGSVLRYLIGHLPVRETTLFPVRTFAINLLGCALIGCLAAVASRNTTLDPRLILFLKVGLCGGFTTFSTFGLETAQLIRSGHPAVAALYVVLSVALGVGLVFGAEALAGQ